MYYSGESLERNQRAVLWLNIKGYLVVLQTKSNALTAALRCSTAL
jgi:hypothetical protein